MRNTLALTLAACLALAGCGSQTDTEDAVRTVDLEGTPGDPMPSPPPPLDTGEDADNDGHPELMPAPLEPGIERTETGARNVLISFARAIELREFDQAWAMLDPADQEEWPKGEWRKLFADLGKITVAAPGGTMEGAAGSSYYTSQATITAKDSEGRPVSYEGPIVLKRVNDVPGASPEQLRWHIESVKLDWTH